MSEDKSKNRLGRGLAALIGDLDENTTDAPSEQISETGVSADRFVPIDEIARNQNNPRQDFDDADLSDLAQSIMAHGVVQPILVRPLSGDELSRWEIIAGERRWRAAQKAGLHEIPVLVREVDDRQALELAIVENVQRSDLNPIEEAVGYQKLMEEHGYTQQNLAKVIGKSRSHVANTLRLTKLPASVQALVQSGEISSGHARALITADTPEELAAIIVEKGLSVRETERLATATADKGSSNELRSAPVDSKSADTIALEKRLSDHLGMKVVINHKNNDGGKMAVSYSNLDQLDDLAQRLVRQPGAA